MPNWAEPGSDAWLLVGSFLAGGVWVISDPVASLAPGLKGLNSWAKWSQSVFLDVTVGVG